MSELVIEIWFKPSADSEVAQKILPPQQPHIVEAEVTIAAGTTMTAAATLTNAQATGGIVEITKAVIKVMLRGAEIGERVYDAAKILATVLAIAENAKGIGDVIEKITVTMGQFSETVHSFGGLIELIKRLFLPQ
jgi:hypothetical protein